MKTKSRDFRLVLVGTAECLQRDVGTEEKQSRAPRERDVGIEVELSQRPVGVGRPYFAGSQVVIVLQDDEA